MGKSEILMLLAGVALSIMLAMVAIPMFSSGSEMADRQQVQQELMAINSAIPLIKALEGGDYITVGSVTKGKITAENIQRHMEGFKIAGTDLKGSKGDLATYTITDTDTTGRTVTVNVTNSKVDLNKLSRLGSICVNVAADGTVKDGVKGVASGTGVDYAIPVDGKSLTDCTMKR